MRHKTWSGILRDLSRSHTIPRLLIGRVARLSWIERLTHQLGRIGAHGRRHLNPSTRRRHRLGANIWLAQISVSLTALATALRSLGSRRTLS